MRIPSSQDNVKDENESDVIMEGGRITILKCPHCSKKFKREWNLNRHITMVHGSEYGCHCNLCGTTFESIEERHEHDTSLEHLNSLLGIGEDPAKQVPSESVIKALKGTDLQPVLSEDEATNVILQKYWSAIRTKLHTRPVLDILNIRTWNGGEGEDKNDRVPDNPGVWEILRNVWRNTNCRVKINCSLGIILENRRSGELRYFHSSANNATEFPSPVSISTEHELSEFYDSLIQKNLYEQARLRRPSTSWMVRHITNITFFVYKQVGMGKVGSVKDPVLALPEYIRCNRSIMGMFRDIHRGIRFDDALCFFRCLAAYNRCNCSTKGQNDFRCSCKFKELFPKQKEVYELYEEYAHEIDSEIPVSQFKGVGVKDLLLLEKIFDVSIVVLTLNIDGESNVMWSSKRPGRKLFLNLYKDHFSYIKDIQLYSNAYECSGCGQCYTRYGHLQRHKCDVANITRMTFPGGTFSPPATVFSRLKDLTGIDVSLRDPNLLFYPYRITYDIEAFLPKNNLPSPTETTVFSSRHELLSISVCSNVPSFTSPICFVRSDGETEDDCVSRFVEYIAKVADKAGEIMLGRFKELLNELQELTIHREKCEKEYCDAKFSTKEVYKAKSQFSKIEEELEHHIRCIPVVGFNSQKYDINIMKGSLMRNIQQIEGKDFNFLIKKTNAMTCIESSRFRFLDICNFIAPGFSYDKYLKAYNCQSTKGYFPYEWMDSLDKLDCTSLPPIECFNSSLRNTKMSVEEYQYCQNIWREQGMTRFEEFLVWYNNLDVEPFLEAIEKQSEIYKLKKIDMLKSAISLPGLSVRWMFTEVEEKPLPPTSLSELHSYYLDTQPIHLLDEKNKDLYKTIKQNLTGGPSIIFNRHQQKDVTRIRKNVYGEDSKVCKEVLGVDANALYLWCLMQNIPTGYGRRRREENGFKMDRQNGSMSAHAWLEYLAWTRRIRIDHLHNNGEKRIGNHNIPVDGFDPVEQKIYQFHGCYWHGHDCSINAKVGEVHPIRKEKMEDLRNDTFAKEGYFRSLGYKVESIWECEWNAEVTGNQTILGFLKIFYDVFMEVIERRLILKMN